MSVSDHSSANLGTTKTGKPRRNWIAIRTQYERGSIGLRQLAAFCNIPVTTVQQRAWREGWKRDDKLVKATAREIEATVDARVKRKLESDLAPWIEAEKAKFTKRGVSLAKTGVNRVRRMFRQSGKSLEAKNESFIAKTAEIYHRIGRVALGMNDGTAPVMPLNLAILGGHTAIQINATSPTPNDLPNVQESQD